MRTWMARRVHALFRLYWRLARPVTLGARVALVRDGEVLLVRHSYGRRWYLPGGGVKRGESFEEAARREAREEVGATLGELWLLGLYHSLGEAKSDHVAVFVAEDFELAPASSREVAASRRFPLHALPADVSPATRRRLERLRERPPAVQLARW